MTISIFFVAIYQTPMYHQDLFEVSENVNIYSSVPNKGVDWINCKVLKNKFYLPLLLCNTK